MVPIVNGVNKDEIEEELEMGRPSTGMRLVDYIPIYIPTIENGLMDETRHERRFFDFLKARPSKEWFLKFGFVGRLSPLAFLKRNPGPADESSSPSDPAPPGARRRFRVPFVRKFSWGSLARYCKKWIRHPANVAFVIWLVFVVAGLIMLFLVMTGILNQLIPSSTRRKRWTEVINQILNALFTIMCLYQHPNLFHHLALLCRWTSIDSVEIRKVYCKDGARRPYERAQMMFVVLLLHITCFAQYTMCGLYWGFTESTRPDWATILFTVLGIAAPAIAGIYTVVSPLGRRRETGHEAQQQVATATRPIRRQLTLHDRRIVVTEPEWIGGLFDCWDDPTAAYCSFFCTFCVFGWNLERLGFGNMYVHIFTFILLCIAPFLIFGAAALNIGDSTIAYTVVIVGAVLCLFGLLYGGFWRGQMRKKFKLPPNHLCCGFPSATDCAQWLFCWSCALAQEVRTGNFYDIGDDSFYRKATDEDGRVVLVPLPREGDFSRRSYSCPPTMEPSDLLVSPDVWNDDSVTSFRAAFERAATFSKVHTKEAMAPPLPPLIQLEDASE